MVCGFSPKIFKHGNSVWAQKNISVNNELISIIYFSNLQNLHGYFNQTISRHNLLWCISSETIFELRFIQDVVLIQHTSSALHNFRWFTYTYKNDRVYGYPRGLMRSLFFQLNRTYHLVSNQLLLRQYLIWWISYKPCNPHCLQVWSQKRICAYSHLLLFWGFL